MSLPTLGLLAIFCDEAQVMYEYLLHYASEGVSQFVLLDQNSIDNGVAVAREFAASRPWLNVTLLAAREQHQQVRHYSKSAHLLRTDWILICDLDEWVYARLGFATIPSFLATLPAEAKLVGLPWLLFGSNLTVAQPSSVIDTFVTRAPTRASRMELKGIVRRSELCTPIATRSKRRPSVLSRWTVLSPESWANVERACGDAECCVEHQHRSSFTAELYLPDGKPAHRGIDLGRFVGSLRDNSSNSWALHMNHYQVGSCEYFTRVKMTRGDVQLGRNHKMRNFDWFTSKDKSQRRNFVVDDELRLKRGPGWLAQCERTVQPTWPNISRVGGQGLARAFKLPVDALGSHCFGNRSAGWAL